VASSRERTGLDITLGESVLFNPISGFVSRKDRPMNSPADISIALDQDACAIAYRAGQLVEKCVIERAIEIARDAGVSTVTADIIRSCVTDDLLEMLKEHLNVPAAKQEIKRTTASKAA
jgi:hypothetical protein